MADIEVLEVSEYFQGRILRCLEGQRRGVVMKKTERIDVVVELKCGVIGILYLSYA